MWHIFNLSHTYALSTPVVYVCAMYCITLWLHIHTHFKWTQRYLYFNIRVMWHPTEHCKQTLCVIHIILFDPDNNELSRLKYTFTISTHTINTYVARICIFYYSGVRIQLLFYSTFFPAVFMHHVQKRNMKGKKYIKYIVYLLKKKK